MMKKTLEEQLQEIDDSQTRYVQASLNLEEIKKVKKLIKKIIATHGYNKRPLCYSDVQADILQDSLDVWDYFISELEKDLK